MGAIGQLIVKPGGTVVIEGGSDEITTYANVTMVMVSPEEVILHFGLRTQENPNRGIGVAKVYLGLAHAKRLAVALKGAIEQIEKVFGEIVEDPATKLPPDELQRLLQKKPEV